MIETKAKRGTIFFLLIFGLIFLSIAIMIIINASIVLGGLFLIFAVGSIWVTYYRIFDIVIENKTISIKRSLNGKLLIDRQSIEDIIIDTFWTKKYTKFFIGEFDENEFSRFYFKINNLNIEVNKSTHKNYDQFISCIQPLIIDKVFTYLDTKKVKDRKRIIVGILILLIFLFLFMGLILLEIKFKK